MSANSTITIIARTQPALRVTARRGPEPPAVTGGYGGWEKLPRPQNVALTQWQGVDPLVIRVPLLFDGWPSRSIEDDCDTLEQMARPAGPRQPPPVLRIVEGAVPHRTLDWVVDTDGLEWGDSLWSRAGDGFRVRQFVNVTLLQYVATDLVAESAAAEAARRASSASFGFGFAPPRSHLVKAGETLLSIAASELGDTSRWTVLRDINGLTDPMHLTPNTTIRLA